MHSPHYLTIEKASKFSGFKSQPLNGGLALKIFEAKLYSWAPSCEGVNNSIYWKDMTKKNQASLQLISQLIFVQCSSKAMQMNKKPCSIQKGKTGKIMTILHHQRQEHIIIDSTFCKQQHPTNTITKISNNMGKREFRSYRCGMNTLPMICLKTFDHPFGVSNWFLICIPRWLNIYFKFDSDQQILLYYRFKWL